MAMKSSAKGLTRIFKECISGVRKKIRTSKLIDLFSQGTYACSSCSAVFSLCDEQILNVIICEKCGCPILHPCRIDDYLLFQPLGGGGMGSVYMCVSFSTRKIYAIKLCPREKKFDPLCVDNLIKEGCINEELAGHRNIVGGVEFGIYGDEHFLVTEFIQGERLDNFVATKSPLPQNDAIDIMLQLIDAELYIFAKGYCYRDLKPENIIIRENGVLKLFDFGLTLRIREAAYPDVEEDMVEGSPHFLPPERLCGAAEKEYSEIYSLGMLLFFILTGRYYFTENKINALAQKHVFGLRINSTSKLINHCTPAMITILDKMIQRDPVDRYQNLVDLRDHLKSIR